MLLLRTIVMVCRIIGGTDFVRHDQITAADWLRLLVREQALSSAFAGNARDTLASITLIKGESWQSAAERVLLRFKATLANASRPHSTEIDFF